MSRDEEYQKREGGHGNHWAAIFDTEEETCSAILDSVNKKELIDHRKDMERNLVVFDSVGDHIKIHTIVEDNQIWTSYPYLVGGISYEIEIERVEEWLNGMEGLIHGELGEAMITFFDTRYLEGRSVYRGGEKHQFSLSGLAYSMRVVEHEKGKEGEAYIAKGFAGFFPAGHGDDTDDFHFGSAVKEILEFEFMGKKFLRIKAPLFKCSEYVEGGDVDVYVYVSHRAVEGSIPKIGDDVLGTIWMQGRLG